MSIQHRENDEQAGAAGRVSAVCGAVAAMLEALVRASRIERQREITCQIVELATTAAQTPMQPGAQGAPWRG
ncbi:hypothetical protein H3V53_23110 [Paraburkholderia bengalensis]|uniref:Uncharacterized protein n=1 Tax=Paraburkholderia bengalensis TaxID=2747562 RepID=A0ABU8IWM0_9BURK